MRNQLVRLAGKSRAFWSERYVRRVLASLTWRARRVRRPIFIWGTGRAGSYLLYDLLSLHPGLVCLRAPHRLSKGLYGSHHHGAGEYASLLDNPFPPVEGAKHHILKRFPEAPDVAAWDEADLRVVKRSYQRLLAQSAAPAVRLLDKSPHYTFLVPLLERLFPDALHVHCVRHPAAVAASYRRRMIEEEQRGRLRRGLWGTLPRGWERVEKLSVTSRAVWTVTETMRVGIGNEALLGDRCRRVSYEALVGNPSRILGEVLAFLELSSTPRIAAAIRTRFPNFNAAPLELPTDSEEVALGFLSMCSTLGYSDHGG
jgi:hypothetical protein